MPFPEPCPRPHSDAALIRGGVMIVDDIPANLKLLEDMLLQEGHVVNSFPLGRLALAAAVENPPDLILLDINMPEMDGYEVCERLKSNAELADVPVIFLSALNETQDKLRAFRAGGVDYISKPFQFEEVHARVETHLKLRGLQRALKRQNEHLEEAVAGRTRELAGALERLTILDRSKNEFLTLISHEFRTPLNGLLGISELILDEMPSTQKNNEFQAMFDRSRRRLLSILDDALLLTQIDVGGEGFKLVPVSLSAALSRAIENTAEFAESRRVALPPPLTGQDLVLGVEELLVRALQALLQTAVKFSEAGETVRFAREDASDSLRVVIESQGRTIPSSVLAKFFDIFSIGEAMTPGGDLGLGPPVAYRILSLFGGLVSVANLDPAGIRFTISLRTSDRNGSDSRGIRFAENAFSSPLAVLGGLDREFVS
jgi:two-component system, sensor histidine kinase and response regulator